MSNKSRSGFVYAALHPNNPNWVKIGLTRRTPWSRLKSLSTTSVREPFELFDARFMWDALASERKAHMWLEDNNIVRQKEFFEIDPLEVTELFNVLEEHDAARPPKISPKRKNVLKSTIDPEEDENDFYDRLNKQYADIDETLVQQDLLDWRRCDLQARWKYVRQANAHDLEVMSSEGCAEASFALAEHIMQTEWSKHSSKHCVALALAAEKQGMPYASLQALQWKSLFDESVLPILWSKMWPWRDKMANNEVVPETVTTVFAVEQQLWKSYPSRSASWTSWSSAPVLRL